jgi:hypothetical protein
MFLVLIELLVQYIKYDKEQIQDNVTEFHNPEI